MKKEDKGKVAEQPVLRAKDWVRHALMKYGLKTEDTAGMSQADAETMLENCREKERQDRQGPATEKQLAELEKLGIEADENITKQEASNAIRDHYRKKATPATDKQMAWLQSHHMGEGIVTRAEASRAIARYIAKEEIPNYRPPEPENGKFAPKDLYLIEARRQYEENDRSFQHFDEIGIVQKMLAAGVAASSIRTTVSVYSPVNAKCTEQQLDKLLELAGSDRKVKNMAEENKRTVRPPSTKQLSLMKKKGIPYKEGMSGLQAASLIARKINLETIQEHKPDLTKERNPVEFYRSFAQAELSKVGWDVKKYTDSKAVVAMYEKGFTKSVICETLDGNSPKCGKSMEQWLERQVGNVIEKHEKQKAEAAREAANTAAKSAFANEMKRADEERVETPLSKLGTEVAYEGKGNVRDDIPLKYELTSPYLAQEGMLLHRIRAMRDIPEIGVKTGDYGGYVFSGKNLSQEGNCWVGEDAKVYRDAVVCDNAVVCGKAEVSDRAVVAGDAFVDGESHLYGNAIVIDEAVVTGHAVVTENGLVCGDGFVKDFACVKGEGFVSGQEEGLSDKAVRDSSQEDIREYRDTLQDTYREIISLEGTQAALAQKGIGREWVDPKTVAPAAITRPDRPALKEASHTEEKKAARSRKPAAETKTKDGEKKVSKPRKRS